MERSRLYLPFRRVVELTGVPAGTLERWIATGQVASLSGKRTRLVRLADVRERLTEAPARLPALAQHQDRSTNDDRGPVPLVNAREPGSPESTHDLVEAIQLALAQTGVAPAERCAALAQDLEHVVSERLRESTEQEARLRRLDGRAGAREWPAARLGRLRLARRVAAHVHGRLVLWRRPEPSVEPGVLRPRSRAPRAVLLAAVLVVGLEVVVILQPPSSSTRSSTAGSAPSSLLRSATPAAPTAAATADDDHPAVSAPPQTVAVLTLPPADAAAGLPAVPTPQTLATPVSMLPDAIPTPAWQPTHRLADHGLPVNFRSGPSTSFPIRRAVLPGTSLRFVGEQQVTANTTWLHFQLADGSDGWIRSIDVAPLIPAAASR